MNFCFILHWNDIMMDFYELVFKIPVKDMLWNPLNKNRVYAFKDNCNSCMDEKCFKSHQWFIPIDK